MELTVAMAIFATFSVVAYGSLRSVIDTKQGSDQLSSRMDELRVAVMLMERDLSQAVNRPVRDKLGDTESAFVADSTTGIRFTRGGWSNPQGLPRSSLRRTGYRLEDEQLIRNSWRALDQAVSGEADDMPLLSEVENLTFRYLDDRDQWIENWPPAEEEQKETALPNAVEIILGIKGMGEIRRLVQLPGTYRGETKNEE